MLHRRTLTLCITFSAVFSFPLKSCGFDKKEILFLIDCRHEVGDQIGFIEQAVNYLRYIRDWKNLNVYYMTHGDIDPISIDVLKANFSEKASDISTQCNDTISVDTLFDKTKQNKASRYSLLRINFIFLKIYEDKNEDLIREIVDIQDKHNSNDRFFILNINVAKRDLLVLPGIIDIDTEKKSHIVRNYFQYTSSFKDLQIINLYPKLCDLKCTDTDLYFESLNFQKSFYHINYTSASHNQGVEQCNKLHNSYLVSIETYEELEYLMLQLLNKMKSSLKDFRSSPVHLGLFLKEGESIFWSSENPFTFYHRLDYDRSKQCVYLEYNQNEMKNVNKTSFWEYLVLIDCHEVLKETFVVCECHVQLNQEPDFVIKTLNKPDTFGLVFEEDIALLYTEYFTNTRELQEVNCTISNYTSSEEKYFCKLSKHTSSLHTYVRVSFLETSHDLYCKSRCFNVFTIHNESNIDGDVARSESYCHTEEEYLCVSNEINKLHNITLMTCKIDDRVSPRCLHMYEKGCRDNSHLENCENFTCPDDFVKCPNSYCIPFATASGEKRQCPLGQEKAIFRQNRILCAAKITMKFKDICLHKHFIERIKRDFGITDLNICDGICKWGYKCLSLRSQDQLMPLLKFNLDLYNISDSLLPDGKSDFYLPYLQIIEISIPECKITNVDKSLEHWNTAETVILDLSANEISDSNTFSSIQSMNTLLLLNLSGNPLFTINENFTLPDSIEVIDLSYTLIESLPVESLGNLHNLSMLNLCYTRIHKFENMGLPKYFKLDTLNIYGLTMTSIKTDFFRGLTVYTKLISSDFKMCCLQILGKNISSSKCDAPKDAISSCRHLVGDTLKRFSVWVVGLMTIVGNGIVLIYRVGWSRKKIFQTAYGLYVTGLAVADFLMGVYLMTIAAVDIFYADVYVVYDASWRNSVLCQFSGFLSTLSSETSTFFIGLITLDRFIVVTYPFSALAISTSLKWKCFISAWTIGFILAVIPAVVPGWQIYSSNGLCLALPLSTTGSAKLPGWEFSTAVYVILNFILFLFIALGQVGILVNIIKNRNLSHRSYRTEWRRQELNIAKKLAFIALSDFLCWFPIGVMGILSLSGYEFDKETYAWMAVFVLPVNSALNPIIYTIPVIVEKFKFKV